MKAFVLRSYGSPDALELTEIDKPVPGDGEVLVRVRATSVQPYDWHLMRGEPYIARLMAGGPGLRKPKITILGADIAGQVEAVGRGVTEFRPGDEVFAMPKQGGFAEYVCVRESELAPKPKNLSFEQAAAVPLAAGTALLGLRDEGRIQAGQRVLVHGASGGVGTFAVQIAKAFGAEVTGVCSTRNVELVRSIGADEVIDYTVEDFTRKGQRYDLLLDNAGSRPGSACRRALTPKGTYVVVGGPGGRWLQPIPHVLAALAVSPFTSRRTATADVVRCTENKQNLITLTGFIEDGRITPVIDRRYPFEEIPEAVRYQEQGRAAGKVVITI
ncbi:NADPH:quinone reductase-like Zn-dependent oxidoreductase [Streptosporangium becharense]|uniref:NADPH:quinone reductase-like Zn-dependent oxidoreductase n=1 Tax=Streptosporangium becharense TaxID=1816182 RepID=A0A7W9MKD3_9ACTN|nr:NAD(P)-dependent alcohol dehydrogenase [Streptosporangium becharense]MBB2914534.1 NADPH:quinone reductase-like Zn-dependent oxidoreductase [Streptosporangium becharense]MBB5823379.1 NADPH:quinone reductase-like Zn-dependent oxidoreductase [Streptosporangium becharense]